MLPTERAPQRPPELAHPGDAPPRWLRARRALRRTRAAQRPQARAAPDALWWPHLSKNPFPTSIPAVTSDYFPTALAAAGIPLPDDRDYDGQRNALHSDRAALDLEPLTYMKDALEVRISELKVMLRIAGGPRPA